MFVELFVVRDLHPNADCVVATDEPNVGAADAPNVDGCPNTLFVGGVPKFDPNAGFAAWLLKAEHWKINVVIHDDVYDVCNKESIYTYIQTKLAVDSAQIQSLQMALVDQTSLMNRIGLEKLAQ